MRGDSLLNPAEAPPRNMLEASWDSARLFSAAAQMKHPVKGAERQLTQRGRLGVRGGGGGGGETPAGLSIERGGCACPRGLGRVRVGGGIGAHPG